MVAMYNESQRKHRDSPVCYDSLLDSTIGISDNFANAEYELSTRANSSEAAAPELGEHNCRTLQAECDYLVYHLAVADDYLHQWKPRAEAAVEQADEWQKWKEDDQRLLRQHLWEEVQGDSGAKCWPHGPPQSSV